MTNPQLGGTPSSAVKTLAIPPLPSIIRYYDDYSEREYAVEPQVSGDRWEVFSEGSVQRLDFAVFSEGLIRDMAKWLVAHCLATVRSGTAAVTFSGLKTVPEDDVMSILSAVPYDAPFVWERLIAREHGLHSYNALKSLMYVACAIRLGGWRPDHADYLNTSFPLPKRDKYASVKAGAVFLALDAEKRVISYLDEVTARRQAATEHELIDAGILLCNYTFGLRPTQIGRLRRRDVTIRTLADGTLSVHLRFQMVKQSATATRLPPLNRRLPYAWAGLFQEIAHRRQGMAADDHFFGFSSSRKTVTRLTDVLTRVAETPTNATDLRHAAAQRLVDAGASREELAAFMGHSELQTGAIYYQTSANQAELLNKALGASPTFVALGRLATSRFISPEELADLRGDQQVAGVPHGIPIAGIGGCAKGQANCPFNPILACYGCDRFMPLRDVTMHERVLDDFRGIAREFFDASRGDTRTPTYLQLARAISDVQSVVDILKDGDADAPTAH